MFRLYLFFSDMRDVYQNAEDNDSVNVLDMAERLWATYSNEQLITLRNAALKLADIIDAYAQKRGN